DNIMFSCCCACMGPTWSTVCGCYQGSGRCGRECVKTSLLDEDLFYSVGLLIDASNATISHAIQHLCAGHSLGGAVSSLISATFGAPVVAFKTPAEKLAVTQLHLPILVCLYCIPGASCYGWKP
ncbi:hypothetical protein V8B97DRAFT_1877955, partial [Scleroderma yunnanense]